MPPSNDISVREIPGKDPEDPMLSIRFLGRKASGNVNTVATLLAGNACMPRCTCTRLPEV